MPDIVYMRGAGLSMPDILYMRGVGLSMPDILYMRGAGLSKPFLHANCLQYAGRPPLLTFFHYVLAVFLLLASNYNFCRPRTGGGGGGGVGKEKKAVGKNEKNLHFFFCICTNTYSPRDFTLLHNQAATLRYNSFRD